MKNLDFKIGTKTIWLLAITHVLLIVFGAIAKIQHWANAEVVLAFSIMLFFTIWIIAINDMVKSRLHNKTFWILSMFIFPFFAAIAYLFRRRNIKI